MLLFDYSQKKSTVILHLIVIVSNTPTATSSTSLTAQSGPLPFSPHPSPSQFFRSAKQDPDHNQSSPAVWSPCFAFIARKTCCFLWTSRNPFKVQTLRSMQTALNPRYRMLIGLRDPGISVLKERSPFPNPNAIRAWRRCRTVGEFGEFGNFCIPGELTVL